MIHLDARPLGALNELVGDAAGRLGDGPDVQAVPDLPGLGLRRPDAERGELLEHLRDAAHLDRDLLDPRPVAALTEPLPARLRIVELDHLDVHAGHAVERGPELGLGDVDLPRHGQPEDLAEPLLLFAKVGDDHADVVDALKERSHHSHLRRGIRRAVRNDYPREPRETCVPGGLGRAPCRVTLLWAAPPRAGRSGSAQRRRLADDRTATASLPAAADPRRD